MNCKNAKMAKKTRVVSALLAAIFGNFGSHKLFHKQYLEMLLYIFSSSFFYLGTVIDTLVYIFDPDFTTYQAEKGSLKKFRTYEFVIKIVGTVICFGYYLYDYGYSFYLYGNVPGLKLLGLVVTVVIIAVVNAIVYCCKGKCCKEVDESPLQEEGGINESLEGIVDQSDLVTPKRIREHLIWYIIGFVIWLPGILIYTLVLNRYVSLVSNKKYYESTAKSIKESNPIESYFMGIPYNYIIISKEHDVTVDNKKYKYRINHIKDVSLENDKNVVIFYSNPENSREQEYRPIMERLVSWGYVVVGNDDAKTSYSGKVLAEVIRDYVRKGYNHDKIGIVGIKLGASGAIKAVNQLDGDPDIKIDALYLCELYSKSILTKFGKDSTYNTNNLPPYRMVVEAGFWFKDMYMSSEQWDKEVHGEILGDDGAGFLMATAFPDKVMSSDDGLLTAWLENKFDPSANEHTWDDLMKEIKESKNKRWINKRQTSE